MYAKYFLNYMTDPSLDIDNDFSGMAYCYLEHEMFSLTIEPVNSAYRIYEQVSHEFGIVSNLEEAEEAEEFTSRFIDGNIEYFKIQLENTELPIDDAKKEKYISGMKKALKEELLEKVNCLWKEKDEQIQLTA